MSKLVITPKSSGKGGHRILSIRIPQEIVNQVDLIAESSGRSRNNIIEMFLKFGIENYVIKEESK